ANAFAHACRLLAAVRGISDRWDDYRPGVLRAADSAGHDVWSRGGLTEHTSGRGTELRGHLCIPVLTMDFYSGRTYGVMALVRILRKFGVAGNTRQKGFEPGCH